MYVECSINATCTYVELTRANTHRIENIDATGPHEARGVEDPDGEGEQVVTGSAEAGFVRTKETRTTPTAAASSIARRVCTRSLAQRPGL